MTNFRELDATETIVVGGEAVECHVQRSSSLATKLSWRVGLPYTEAEFITSVGSVIAKLAKRFVSGADPCSKGCPRCKLVKIVPKPVCSRGHGGVADKRVSRVCDPERGGNLVRVEERGGTTGQDAEVTNVAVVGLYSILLEWE